MRQNTILCPALRSSLWESRCSSPILLQLLVPRAEYCGRCSHSAMRSGASPCTGTGEIAARLVVQIRPGGPSCLLGEAACPDLCHLTTPPCCSRTRSPTVVVQVWVVLHAGSLLVSCTWEKKEKEKKKSQCWKAIWKDLCNLSSALF